MIYNRINDKLHHVRTSLITGNSLMRKPHYIFIYIYMYSPPSLSLSLSLSIYIYEFFYSRSNGDEVITDRIHFTIDTSFCRKRIVRRMVSLRRSRRSWSRSRARPRRMRAVDRARKSARGCRELRIHVSRSPCEHRWRSERRRCQLRARELFPRMLRISTCRRPATAWKRRRWYRK